MCAHYCCDSLLRVIMSVTKFGRLCVNGEAINCVREAGNYFNCFAVFVVKDGEVVGHMPKKS